MKKALLLLLIVPLIFSSQVARATTVIGDLGNFDTLNDTGQICYGFEIEIDGIHSTDISYTFDWNHYGTPKIREDNADPANPKVFVRYESTPDASGNWGAPNSVTNARSLTNQAIPTITPPQGHTCTDPTVNEGCEHFGVGYNTAPTNIVYNWLVDGGPGQPLATFGTPVKVAAPAWNYTPPVGGANAQVVAVIPAPVVPVPAGKQFGEPSWVKVIKTTSHNANPVELRNLVSPDELAPGPDWRNGEADEVETEWKLLQTNTGANPAKDELAGLADDMGAAGDETVTRRYEFYEYAADSDPGLPTSIDEENGEAMCDEMEPGTLYGLSSMTAVDVAEAGGESHSVNCATRILVGNYIGAQMVGFDAAAVLGLIDHLQDGELGTPYVDRTVVIGGNVPYKTINITGGALPNGLSLPLSGVLSGTPTESGDFNFTVEATDGSDVVASKAYALHIVGPAVPQHQLSVDAIGPGGISGNGIDCTANTGTCNVMLDDGTAVVLSAAPGTDAVFNGWTGGYCTGTGSCSFSLTHDSTVGATFTQQYNLSVAKSGGGTGTVNGNGIDCGAVCSLNLDAGTAVSLTATAASGSLFTGWSGDCSGTGLCTTTMNAGHTVTATFVPSTQTYTLSVTTSGKGIVSDGDPKGINCGSKCSKSVTVGSTVTLTAKPKGKALFLGWSGACSGTALTCTVPVLSNSSVTATFN